MSRRVATGRFALGIFFVALLRAPAEAQEQVVDQWRVEGLRAALEDPYRQVWGHALCRAAERGPTAWLHDELPELRAKAKAVLLDPGADRLVLRDVLLAYARFAEADADERARMLALAADGREPRTPDPLTRAAAVTAFCATSGAPPWSMWAALLSRGPEVARAASRCVSSNAGDAVAAGDFARSLVDVVIDRKVGSTVRRAAVLLLRQLLPAPAEDARQALSMHRADPALDVATAELVDVALVILGAADEGRLEALLLDPAASEAVALLRETGIRITPALQGQLIGAVDADDPRADRVFAAIEAIGDAVACAAPISSCGRLLEERLRRTSAAADALRVTPRSASCRERLETDIAAQRPPAAGPATIALRLLDRGASQLLDAAWYPAILDLIRGPVELHPEDEALLTALFWRRRAIASASLPAVLEVLAGGGGFSDAAREKAAHVAVGDARAVAAHADDLLRAFEDAAMSDAARATLLRGLASTGLPRITTPSPAPI